MTITIWRWHLIIPWRWQLRFRFAIKTLNTCRVRIANNMHLGWHWKLLWRWHILIPWRWQLHFRFVLQTLNTCRVRNANNKRSQSSWSRPYHRERWTGIGDNGSGDCDDDGGDKGHEVDDGVYNADEQDLQMDSGTDPPWDAFPPKFHLEVASHNTLI